MLNYKRLLFSNNILIFLIIILFEPINSQNFNSRDLDLDIDDQFLKLTESFILENEIDPEGYILGPGDKIGLNISTNINLTYILTITPTGYLWIPNLGKIHISGLSIIETQKKITEYIHNNKFNSAFVQIALMNLRKFKVQVIGAVNSPGFITVTPLDRLSNIINKCNGLHKHANEENIEIIDLDKTENYYSLKDYRLNGHLDNNPIVKEGSVINVPYYDKYLSLIAESMTFKENPIIVTGYVLKPGSYKYLPGYSISDYIGLSGGVSDMGSNKKITIIRDGLKMNDFNTIILPGDQIYVHSNMKYRFLGNISILQTITAIMSLYLTFVAATK